VGAGNRCDLLSEEAGKWRRVMKQTVNPLRTQLEKANSFHASPNQRTRDCAFHLQTPHCPIPRWSGQSLARSVCTRLNIAVTAMRQNRLLPFPLLFPRAQRSGAS